MTSLVGACVGFAGIMKTIAAIEDLPNSLNRNVQISVGDSTATKVARVFANLLHVISLLATAVSLLMVGSFLISLPPTAALLPSLQQAILAILPYLGGAIGAATASQIIRHIAR